MKALLHWLDDRTGYRNVLNHALFEHIPGGARWRYVWGSTLVFAFTVQVITGLFLWMCYSPNNQGAWESVYYIQHEMVGGWFLRGLHHFTAQAMIVLLVLHLMQVVIDGAYRAPREVNFWLGLILMMIVLGLSLTGYLLPWDQKGYWATRVATNLMGIVPFVGPELQKLVVGGSDYGNFTLTRFFALHAGVLPLLLVGFLVVHVALFRRHGLHAKQPFRKADSTFWPDQVLKDIVACLAVLAVVVLLIVKPALFGEHAPGMPPGDYLGADLGAPADRANEYSAARPEWYFLFLFQFLKLFEGQGEFGEKLGALYIPGAIMGVLFLMPILGRWKLGHRFNVGFLCVLMLGIAALTVQAMRSDRDSQSYRDAVAEAEMLSERAVVLARAPSGIPTDGVVSLMRKDTFTNGRQLFRRYCASCHAHTGPDGLVIRSQSPAAPDLGRFGSRRWVEGVLDPDQLAGPDYFGSTSHYDGLMVEWLKNALRPTDKMPDMTKEEVEKIVKAVSAEAKLHYQQAEDASDAEAIAAGKLLIVEKGCIECHKFHDEGSLGPAPDLTDYGSLDWLKGMIGDPNHERFYVDNNEDNMPAFVKQMTPEEIELLARWLRRDWYEPEVKGKSQPAK